MKAGTSIRHGRGIETWNNGFIRDCFYFEGKFHGPRLRVYAYGNCEIDSFAHGESINSKRFRTNELVKFFVWPN